MGKQIKPKLAKELCDNFDAKYKALSKLINKDDNRSVLFSLQELKNYIDYLENAKDDVDGIHVYFGSYLDNKGPKGKDSNDLTTIFLAPTFKAKDNLSLDAYNMVGNNGSPSKKYGI